VERFLTSLFLIAVGAGVLAVTRQGFVSGVLPAGSSLFRAFRPTRGDHPLAFHFFLALYFCGGMALLVWGILALFGGAPVLRLR
jgi:hypothetical protein